MINIFFTLLFIFVTPLIITTIMLFLIYKILDFVEYQLNDESCVVISCLFYAFIFIAIVLSGLGGPDSKTIQYRKNNTEITIEKDTELDNI